MLHLSSLLRLGDPPKPPPLPLRFEKLFASEPTAEPAALEADTDAPPADMMREMPGVEAGVLRGTAGCAGEHQSGVSRAWPTARVGTSPSGTALSVMADSTMGVGARTCIPPLPPSLSSSVSVSPCSPAAPHSSSSSPLSFSYSLLARPSPLPTGAAAQSGGSPAFL